MAYKIANRSSNWFEPRSEKANSNKILMLVFMSPVSESLSTSQPDWVIHRQLPAAAGECRCRPLTADPTLPTTTDRRSPPIAPPAAEHDPPPRVAGRRTPPHMIRRRPLTPNRCRPLAAAKNLPPTMDHDWPPAAKHDRMQPTVRPTQPLDILADPTTSQPRDRSFHRCWQLKCYRISPSQFENLSSKQLQRQTRHGEW